MQILPGAAVNISLKMEVEVTNLGHLLICILQVVKRLIENMKESG